MINPLGSIHHTVLGDHEDDFEHTPVTARNPAQGHAVGVPPQARTHGRVRYDEEELRDWADTLDTSDATETVAAVSRLLDSFGDGVDDDTALLALSVRLPGDERP